MGITSTQSTQISNNNNKTALSSGSTVSTSATGITIPIANYNPEQVKNDVEKIAGNGLSNIIAGSRHISERDIQDAFYKHVDNLEEATNNGSGIKNFLESTVRKVKDMFSTTQEVSKSSKATEAGKNLTQEEIKQGMNFVASHIQDGIDDESADFRALPPNVQNYVRQIAKEAQEEYNKGHNVSKPSDSDSKVKAAEKVIN